MDDPELYRAPKKDNNDLLIPFHEIAYQRSSQEAWHMTWISIGIIAGATLLFALLRIPMLLSEGHFVHLEHNTPTESEEADESSINSSQCKTKSNKVVYVDDAMEMSDAIVAAFTTSILTQSTVGAGDILPQSNVAKTVTAVQGFMSISGMLLVGLSIAPILFAAIKK